MNKGLVSNFQPYTIREFDAILAVAYAVRDLYNDGLVLSTPAFGRLDLKNKHDPYRDGSTFINYIAEVREV